MRSATVQSVTSVGLVSLCALRGGLEEWFYVSALWSPKGSVEPQGLGKRRLVPPEQLCVPRFDGLDSGVDFSSAVACEVESKFGSRWSLLLLPRPVSPCVHLSHEAFFQKLPRESFSNEFSII